MKRFLSFIAGLLIIAAVSFSGAGRVSADLPLVVDRAGIFSEAEIASLTDRVGSMVDTYGHGYVLLTDIKNDGKSKDLYAADFLYDNGYWNESNDGATVFYLSLEEGNRGWRTISIGANEDIFTEDVCYYIDELVDSNMRSGNYYQAFSDQVDYVEELFRTGKATPIEDGSRVTVSDNIGQYLPTGIIVGLVIGFVVVAGMKKGMRLNPETAAANYLLRDSFNLRGSREYFLYRNVTRTEKPRDRDRGGSSFGGGSSSSGGHYSGGGRDF